MRCTYPPSSPGLPPWQHLHDCSAISAPAQPSSCLIQILWLCLFTPDPFLRPSLYSSHKQSPPPVYPLSLSQPLFIFPSFFSTDTCTCINKAVVSHSEIYLILILSLPHSPPFRWCLQDTAGRSPTFVMLHECTPTPSEGWNNSLEGK